MNTPSNPKRSDVVSIHPYFKVHPGKLDAAKKVLRKFVEKTASERDVLYYDFTINGDEVYCREAYNGGQALLKHLENVAAVLEEMLSLSDLARLEIHTGQQDLDLLKERLGHLKPAWFVFECGLQR